MISGGVENAGIRYEWQMERRLAGLAGEPTTVDLNSVYEVDWDLVGDIAAGILCVGTLGIVCAAGCDAKEPAEPIRQSPQTPPQQPVAAPTSTTIRTNPVDSYCNVIPSDYSFKLGTRSIETNNISINGMKNAAFDAILGIWGGDAGLSREDAQDWVVTKSQAGPMTMDNVCHVNQWWTISDGTFLTPEFWQGIEVDYGYQDEQKKILHALYTSGAAVWHSDVIEYMGEYINIAEARWALAQGQDANVDTYIATVKAAFAAQAVNNCSALTASYPIEYFFNGVAPLAGDKLTEAQIQGALKKLGEVDTQMADIVMAAWYIRAAKAIKSTNVEAANAWVVKSYARVSALLGDCPLPQDKPSDEVMTMMLGFIADPDRRKLVQWIVDKIYEFVIDHCINDVQDGDETGVDCGGTCTTACPPPPPATTAADCLNQSPPRARQNAGHPGLHLVDGECVPCPEATPITTNGRTCRVPGGGHGPTPPVVPPVVPPVNGGRGFSVPWTAGQQKK